MKVTSVFGPLSGKLGGSVASRNRGGTYFRLKGIPTNPNTARQQVVRSYMTAAVNSWIADLDAAQREAWKTYASNTPYTDSLGQTVTMTGQNAYIASYVARAMAGLPIVEDAPTTFDAGQPVVGVYGDYGTTPLLNVISLDSGVLADTNVVLMSPAPDDGDVILQIGKPVNSTVNYYKGPYQFAVSTPIAAAATGVALTTTGLEQAEPLVVGQFRPVRVRIAYDDGRVSAPYEAICEVVEITT